MRDVDKTGTAPTARRPTDAAAPAAVPRPTDAAVSPAALTASLYARPVLDAEMPAEPEDAPMPFARRRMVPPKIGPDVVNETRSDDGSRPRRPDRLRTGLGGRLLLLAIAVGVAVVVFGLAGATVPLPVWAVVEVENRLNAALEPALNGGAISVGDIAITLEDDWSPHLHLGDLRLLKPGGSTLFQLPETNVALDRSELLQGRLRVKTLHLAGAAVAVRRDAEGRFDLNFGRGQGPRIDSLAALFVAVDRTFALPALSHLRVVEADGLSFTLTDERSGRTWALGDGRLRIDNRPEELAAQLGLSLTGGAGKPAPVDITVIAAKGATAAGPGQGAARILVSLNNIAAADLAAQAAPLAWLGVLEAPISGQLSAQIDAAGVSALTAQLDIGRGRIKPRGQATPVEFDQAGIGISYAAAEGRVNLGHLEVQSPELRLRASGQSYLLDEAGAVMTGSLTGRWPASFLGQIAFSDVAIDPEGLFDRPLQFSEGSADLRLRLDPLTLDLGQMVLKAGKQQVSLRGAATATEAGWRLAADFALTQITRKGLLAIWPDRLIPKTRDWLAGNVSGGVFRDVTAALRLEPGGKPRMQANFDYAEAEVRVMAAMPPVIGAAGYVTVLDNRLTQVLRAGTVTPPEGGAIDLAGSTMTIPDIYARPSRAEVVLTSRSSMTAALSLLNQPPFFFLDKAGRPVDLGQGLALARSELRLPLQKNLKPGDVLFDVTGELRDFASDILVEDHRITAPLLQVAADPGGMRLAGPGKIGALPFDVVMVQRFGADAPPTRITGEVELSPLTVAEFGLGLPRGMVTGRGAGQVVIDLPRGAAGRMSLTSDLRGVVLAIPELAWRKAAAATGRLSADLVLSSPPAVPRLEVSGGGLEARGTVSFTGGGDLQKARFSTVTLNNWLDATVEITGRGSRSLGLAVTDGSIDFRRFPSDRGSSGPGTGGSPLSIALDRLQVTDSIALTGFRGDFSLAGGFNGTFAGRVNGQAPVTGTVVPAPNGTSVRVDALDAGAVMAAAGLFGSARGGAMRLTLTPRERSGHYDGAVKIGALRVVDANVLAELLSLISVVGLLEQLGGPGIQFNEAQANFVMTPDAVQVVRSSAVGASLGVSMAGIYHADSARLDMDGVVSPIYLLNGVGAFLTRRGEGFFGFNYRLTGTAEEPNIAVNPLSILTPGMFREIFRAPPPVLEGGG